MNEIFLTERDVILSVVIVCYNYGEFLSEAVGSVVSQTFKHVEVIVVDGGSNDEHTLLELDKLSEEGYTIYQRKGRHLVGDNRNYGISRASGKYICCLDADDLIRPSYLEKAVMLLELAGANIVSCSRQNFGESSEVSLLKYEPTMNDVLVENQLNTVAVFEKALWETVGGYQDFGLGEDHIHEDWMFWMKCVASGAVVKNLNHEILFKYRVHSSGSLSQQGGTVRSQEAQRSFIQKAFDEYTEGQTPVFEREHSDVFVPETMATQNNVMIVVPCFDLETVVALEEYILGRNYDDRELVLVSMDRYVDKRDSLGSRLDELCPRHYDFQRSFSNISFPDFLSFIVRNHGVGFVEIFDHCLNSTCVVELCRELGAIESIHVSLNRCVLGKTEVLKSVRLSNSGMKNPSSHGCELWILGIRNDEGIIIFDSLFRGESPKGFEAVDCDASPIGRALVASDCASLDLDLPAGAQIEFLVHDWSGIVMVNSESIDLYQPQSGTKVVEVH